MRASGDMAGSQEEPETFLQHLMALSLVAPVQSQMACTLSLIRGEGGGGVYRVAEKHGCNLALVIAYSSL